VMQDEGLDPFPQLHMYHQGRIVGKWLRCRLGCTHDTGLFIVYCILSYTHNYFWKLIAVFIY
jgi:hypothetical protein